MCCCWLLSLSWSPKQKKRHTAHDLTAVNTVRMGHLGPLEPQGYESSGTAACWNCKSKTPPPSISAYLVFTGTLSLLHTKTHTCTPDSFLHVSLGCSPCWLFAHEDAKSIIGCFFLYAKFQCGIWQRDMLVQHDIMKALTFWSIMLHVLFCIRIFCSAMNRQIQTKGVVI